jgi:SAM-dependent methyltransferase
MKSKMKRFYESQYSSADETFINWRSVRAKERVHNIINMTEGIEFKNVMDIGCGTGAVIKWLSDSDFASSYYAVDLSEKAVKLVRSIGIKNLRGVVVSDAEKLPYKDASFDLAILSHILEHTLKPAAMLREASRVAKFVYVEIPLENTPLLTFVWKLRELIKGKTRDVNPLGHITFFSQSSADKLCREVGLKKIRAHWYLAGKEEFLFQKRGLRFIYAYAVYLSSRLLGSHIFARLYHSTYTMLLMRKRIEK